MIPETNAQLSVWKGIVHLCSGYIPIKCLYEYTKNLQDAGAKDVFLEMLPQRKVILIYGDGSGMTDLKMTEVMRNIGESLKSKENHGLGMQCWPRIATRMTIFSRVDGVLYTVSCSRHDNEKDVYLHGGAREAGSADQEYRDFYNKLNKGVFKNKDGSYKNGTLTILEGIGVGSDDHYDFKFKMKEDLNSKDIIDFFRDEHSRSFLTACRFSVKKDEDSPLTVVEPKIGIGKKIEFTIPSKRFPEKEIPGNGATPKNCFFRNGFMYELVVDFIFHFGASNEANITVTNNGKDPVLISNIRHNGISRDGVYRNPEYLRFINGHIDIHIRPLNDGDPFTIHNADRSSIILSDDFGRCFTNILLYADTEILRSEVEQQLNRVTERKQLKSTVFQKHMENICDQFKDFLDQYINTKSTGLVHDNTVECSQCQTRSIPRRLPGLTLKWARNHLEKGVIFAPEDIPRYVCGSCGHDWNRRAYNTNSSGHSRTNTPGHPHYRQPGPGQGMQRQRQHGYGYSFHLMDFSAGDTQIAMLKGEDMVCVNRGHPNYKVVEKSGDLRCIYEGQNAFHVLLTNEFSKAENPLPKEEQLKALKEMDNNIIIWVQNTDRKKLKGIEDMTAPVSHTEEIPPVSAQDLGEKWGAKVKKESKK